MMELNTKKYDKVKPSLKYLNFVGWMKFFRECWCMLIFSGFISSIVSMLLIFALVNTPYVTDTTPAWPCFLIFGICYIITVFIMYNVSCKGCVNCKLEQLCKDQMDTKNKQLRKEYMVSQTSNIEKIREEIERLRKYIDKLLSFEKSEMITDEIHRTLRQISLYENMADRFDEELKNEK